MSVVPFDDAEDGYRAAGLRRCEQCIGGSVVIGVGGELAVRSPAGLVAHEMYWLSSYSR